MEIYLSEVRTTRRGTEFVRLDPGAVTVEDLQAIAAEGDLTLAIFGTPDEAGALMAEAKRLKSLLGIEHELSTTEGVKRSGARWMKVAAQPPAPGSWTGVL